MSLREQLKATSIKKLQKQVASENEMAGVNSNDYLNLEDGKTIKIRIFPAHPGADDFYVMRKCYWMTFLTSDGESRRGTVMDSRVHGGTKMDVVEEYVKAAKQKIGNDAEKLEALVGNGPKSNSLNPSYTWLCYADRINGDDPLKAKIWEFKKTVRDELNRLAFSEDEDEVIEVDPFTDPDEGLPISVTYNKNPNKKKGEKYYDVCFPKKVTARPLTDDEIEYFMTLKPLSEVLGVYGLKDFEKALEGLQNFDEENEIGLFDDDAWLSKLETIRAQYVADSDDEEKPKTKKAVKKLADDEEEEEEKPAKKAKKAVKEPEPEPDDDDDDEEEEEETDADDGDDDEFTEMSRNDLKKYISKNGLDIVVKKSMSDDDIRNLIRKAQQEEETAPDEEEEEETDADDEEEEKPKAKITLSDIRAKLAGKK